MLSRMQEWLALLTTPKSSIASIPSDAALLQTDLSNLEKRSSTSGLVFNQLKCKCLRVTRKTQPVTYLYHIKDKELTTTSFEKDLGIWIASDLTWTRHVLERCAKANKLLGFVRRSGGEITNVKTRRMLYLSVVRPILGYASQVWSPQTIGLIKRTERVQRRASKFMLNLPLARVYGSSVLLQSHKWSGWHLRRCSP